MYLVHSSIMSSFAAVVLLPVEHLSTALGFENIVNSCNVSVVLVDSQAVELGVVVAMEQLKQKEASCALHHQSIAEIH